MLPRKIIATSFFFIGLASSTHSIAQRNGWDYDWLGKWPEKIVCIHDIDQTDIIDAIKRNARGIQYLSSNNDRHYFYKKGDGKNTFWYGETGKLSINGHSPYHCSMRQLYKYDCEDFKIKLLKTITYSDAFMAETDGESQPNENIKWQYMDSESIKGQILNKQCKRFFGLF